MRLALLLCAFAGITALSQPAAAQESDVDRAMELNSLGLAAFDEGRFVDAANHFAAAWEISHNESLRKNEAFAWFRAGECSPAIEAANKFLLAEDIADEDRTDVHSVIANCKVQFVRQAIAAEDLDLAESLLRDAEALEPDAVARDNIATARVDLASARLAAQEPRTPEIRTVFVEQEREVPVLGYSLIGAGAAAIVGTLVYHVIAFGWQSEFLRMQRGEITPDRERFDSLRKRVHLARVLVPTFYSLGVLTVGAGVTLAFFVEPRQTEGETAAGVVLGVRGQF